MQVILTHFMGINYTYNHKTSQRAVVNLNTRKIYNSLTEAGMDYGVKYGPSCAIKNCKKFKGCYWQYKDVIDKNRIEEELKRIDQVVNERKNKRLRAVVNLKTKEIFNSIKDAERHYGVNDRIFNAIKTKTRCCKCYWQYKDIVDQSSIEAELAKTKPTSTARAVINLNT